MGDALAPHRWRLQEIRHAIRALGADPASQLAYVAGIGPGNLEDEFYNTVLDHIDEVKGVLEFSAAARRQLERIEEGFRRIGEAEAWSEDALRSVGAWADIRESAHALAGELPDAIRMLEPPRRSLEEADLHFVDEGSIFGLFVEERLYVGLVAGSDDRWACLDLRATLVAGGSSLSTRWLEHSSLIEGIISWIRARSWEKQSPVRDRTGHLLLEARDLGEAATLMATISDPTRVDARAAAEIMVDRETRATQADRLQHRLEYVDPRIVEGLDSRHSWMSRWRRRRRA